MNSNMITNKTNKIVCRIKQSILYLTFLPSEFIEAVLTTFADIILVTIVDTISITYIISSNLIFESSTILFRYLLLSQIHVPGFQL